MIDEEEIKIRATRAQIENFMESFVWEDIKRELKNWKEGFIKESTNIVTEAETSNPSTASVL